MALFECAAARACVFGIAWLCLAHPAIAESRLSASHATNRPAASNPYRSTGKRHVRTSTQTIARWTEPPSFAIAPRTIGISYGSSYFDRSAVSGPNQRGSAYNVRRKPS
jgi:hypothetical protein